MAPPDIVASGILHLNLIPTSQAVVTITGWGKRMEISQETMGHVRRLFQEVADDDARLRATMGRDEYARHRAQVDLDYCRRKLDPGDEQCALGLAFLPTHAERDAYEARIRDLTHFLKTGRHLDEDEA